MNSVARLQYLRVVGLMTYPSYIKIMLYFETLAKFHQELDKSSYFILSLYRTDLGTSCEVLRDSMTFKFHLFGFV